MPDPGHGLRPQTYEQLARIVVAIDEEIEALAYGRQVIQKMIEEHDRRQERLAALANPSAPPYGVQS